MIRDKKDLDAFVARMAAGKKSAGAKRASSTAPPSPPVKSKGRVPTELNTVSPPPTHVAAPKAPTGRKKVPTSDATKRVTIHIHNH